MKTLIEGHRYVLDMLDGKPDEKTTLQYVQRPPHPSRAGVTCQEVLRSVIVRVQALDRERPWCGNRWIIRKLREVIVLFEMRALWRKIHKADFPVELIEVNPHDGHFALRLNDRCGGY